MSYRLRIGDNDWSCKSHGRELGGVHSFEGYRKYLIQFHRTIRRHLDEIFENIRANRDDRAINELKTAIGYIKKHKEETRTSSPNSLKGQMVVLLQLKRITQVEGEGLLSKINSLGDILEALNRKKALILCQVFTQEDLQVEWKNSDLEEAFVVLSVRGDKDKANVKKNALHLASIAESDRLTYCVTPGYKNFLEGYKLDANQEMQKYNEREFSYWVSEVQNKISEAHAKASNLPRAVVESRRKNGDSKPKRTPDSKLASVVNPPKKSPGTPKELTQEEIDAIMLHTFEEVAKHNIRSYDDFTCAIATKIGHGVSKQKVCERLTEIGLCENDFYIMRAYRELGGHVNGEIDLESIERQLERHEGFKLSESTNIQSRLIFLRFQFPSLMGVKNSTKPASDIKANTNTRKIVKLESEQLTILGFREGALPDWPQIFNQCQKASGGQRRMGEPPFKKAYDSVVIRKTVIGVAYYDDGSHEPFSWSILHYRKEKAKLEK